MVFRMLQECKCLKISKKFIIMSLNMDHKPPNANRWSGFMRGKCNLTFHKAASVTLPRCYGLLCPTTCYGPLMICYKPQLVSNL